MNALYKPTLLLRCPPSLRLVTAQRLYATQTGLGTSNETLRPKRKTVTPFNDDGRVPWGDLSAAEKTARTTQQTVNFGVIILGAVLTAGVTYVMYTEVFAGDSKTRVFNRAVDQVKKHQKCIDILGDSKKITAYGEPTWNKWARARPIASNLRKDQYGVEHLIMHFNVEGPKSKGVVNLHMIKRPSDDEFAYKYLTLEAPGQQRVYLENADATADSPAKNKTKLFGVSWR